MSTYVIRFQEIDRSKFMLAGGKGANLGELSRIKEIRGADADEALQCYKSLLDVLDFQSVNETIEICHYLRPI